METSKQRIHSMDALRAIAMLLGIVLHGLIPYRKFVDPNWPVDDAFHSYGFDILYYAIHTFRMPLFFLIAGFFARFLYLKIGEKAFIKHRFKRIFVPFIFCLFTIIPLTTAPFIYYSASSSGTASVMGALYKSFTSWNGLVHIWFLYYLVLMYAIMIFMLHLKVLFPKKLNHLISIIISHVNFTSVKGILILCIPLTIVELAYKGIIVGTYTGLKLDTGMFLWYGSFFFIGWIVHIKFKILFAISKIGWPCLILGVLLLIPVILNYRDAFNFFSFRYLSLKYIAALQQLMMIFGFMGLFLKYLSAESKTLRYISDSSYWFYLIHLGMLVTLQELFISSGIPGYLRWLVALAITTVISLVSYDLFIRYTFIGTMLNGPKKRPGKEPKKKVSAKQITFANSQNGI